MGKGSRRKRFSYEKVLIGWSSNGKGSEEKYLEYLRELLILCLQVCHAQICHLRDICVDVLFFERLLSVMSSKDFKLALIVSY